MMKSTVRSVLLWGFLAVTCIVLLSKPAYAAEQAVSGYEGGPGVCYDEAGNIVAAELEEAASVVASVTGEGASIVEEPHPEGTAAAEGEVAAETDGTAAAENKTETEAASQAAEETAVGSTTKEGEEDETIYTHNGVKYKKGSSWGDHRLTGYSREQNGSLTASGKDATPNHTVAASSELPLGTVIIVEGFKGPNASDYDGVYVVEDRGGEAVEGGLVDIFFETHKEADGVTYHGWNTAHVWIAEKVE